MNALYEKLVAEGWITKSGELITDFDVIELWEQLEKESEKKNVKLSPLWKIKKYQFMKKRIARLDELKNGRRRIRVLPDDIPLPDKNNKYSRVLNYYIK